MNYKRTGSLAVLLLSAFAMHSSADEPKERHPSMTATAVLAKAPSQADRVDGFTLKATDFWRYGRGDANGIHGIRHREFWAVGIVFANMRLNRYAFHRDESGMGGSVVAVYIAKEKYFNQDLAFETVKTHEKYSELYGGVPVEPTLEMLRDIFGADAVSDVRITPAKDVGSSRDPIAQDWHRRILDALSKSGGDTMQAAARINLSEQQISKMLKEYNANTVSR